MCIRLSSKYKARESQLTDAVLKTYKRLKDIGAVGPIPSLAGAAGRVITYSHLCFIFCDKFLLFMLWFCDKSLSGPYHHFTHGVTF